MQGSIVQAVALANWGNSYLQKGRDPDSIKFFPDNSAFSFCKTVKFIGLEKSGTTMVREEFAHNPNEWIKKLQELGVQRISLRYTPTGNTDYPDRMTVGLVGGGGRWILEAENNNGASLWEIIWDLGDENDPESKIWNVTYRKIGNSYLKTSQQSGPVIEETNSRLKSVLQEISAFAKSKNLDDFVPLFANGLAALESRTPLDFCYHKDIAHPEDFSLKAFRTFGCVQAAWVFGGMGSWNDIGFENLQDQAVYAQLSDELFDLFTKGILASVNTGMA